MVFSRNNEMELSLTKLRIGLVIFPLILLTVAPILYIFLGYPLYYSSSSSSNQHNISSPQSSLYGNDYDEIYHDPKASSSPSSSIYKKISNLTSSSSSSTISSPSLSSRHNHSSSSSSSSSTISSSFSSRHNHSSNSSSSSTSNNHNTSTSQPSYDDTYHDHPNSSSSSYNDHSISSSLSSSNLDHDDHQETPKKEHRRKKRKPNKCDLFIGEWIPNHEAPYYTNTTCWAIHEHQNCMKYGRPDLGFMKWRWKPKECDLPLFDPYKFLEIVRGKSMAFVGDSVSRNHVQSLICLLSRVEFPEDDSRQQDFNFQRWKYKTYNFTIATFWTTHLVRSEETTPTSPTGPNSFYNLYLDEPDPSWASQVVEFDYIIVSSGQWFFRPLFLFDKQKMIGCLYCYIPGVRNVGAHFAYRRALRTMFKTILGLENFKGEVFLRTFAPSHFENGDWDKGGNCLRTRPYRSSETDLEGMNLETHNIQIDEFRIAKRKKNSNSGLNFRLLDVTQAMLLRPDGHPSRFGHKQEDEVILYNDCVHWCLPGPIDSWNDFLLEMLKNRVWEIKKKIT